MWRERERWTPRRSLRVEGGDSGEREREREVMSKKYKAGDSSFDIFFLQLVSEFKFFIKKIIIKKVSPLYFNQIWIS